MRVETSYDHQILCEYIFNEQDLIPGTRWINSSGSIVTIESMDQDWVVYSWDQYGSKQTNTKDWFSFQCRYCLILE